MSRCWIGEYNESAEQEAWRGYEFWSSQVEAEMDFIEGDETAGWFIGQSDLAARAHTEGAGDVLPF